jgi:hypothetical protein
MSKSLYIIRQRNTRTYYSDILDDRHCIFGFTYRKHASMFTRFLNDYKKKYSRYPSATQKMVHTKFIFNPSPLCIEQIYTEEMKVRCVVNGLNLFEIHNFDYEYIHEINFSGTHLTEGLEVSPMYIRSHLNDILSL